MRFTEGFSEIYVARFRGMCLERERAMGGRERKNYLKKIQLEIKCEIK